VLARSRCRKYGRSVPSELSAEQRAEGWKRSLGDPSVFKLLAVLDNTIAGFIFSGPTRDIEGADGEVYAMNVLALYYRKGIGSALLNAAKANWRERDGKSLGVISANLRARAFYEAQGGKEIGERYCTIGNESLAETIYRFEL
jgi:GNAT superfamily N-acetyltransferase